MKAASFDYHRATSLADALGQLDIEGEVKVLAGGQSLVPLLNMRLARPAALVDIGRLGELSEITPNGTEIVIGAMVRQRDAELSDLIAEACPLLVEALGLVAHPQIRHRGTVGGSVAHADPSAELPAVVLALDGVLRVAGIRSTRAIPARDFFRSYLTTALAPDEILTAVEVPSISPTAGWSCQEVTRRPGDFPLCGVAVQLDRTDEGQMSDVRIAMFGVADTPVRAAEAEAMLEGAAPDDELIVAAARAAAAGLEPMSDIHGSSEYRRRLTRVTARRTLTEALRRCRVHGR